jgi:predicted nucleotide-binding protein (sugar kinase/HSP70/actin superfamily)
MSWQQKAASRKVPPTHPLYGKKTFIPRMAHGSCEALAAVLRSLGIDAEVLPTPDAHTLDLGAKHSNGDECYPLKITLGDYLGILERPGLDPRKTAFFLFTGQGPCRFGQYAVFLRSMLDKLGYPEITVFHPSCEHGYSDFGEASTLYTRGAWRAIVSADVLLKLLLKSRPHEVVPGAADAVYEDSIASLSRVLEVSYPSNREQMESVQHCLLTARRRFRSLALQFNADKPLIGVVGEIFCRLNDFSNNELVRRLEDAGAEVWMNDISEWIWYTNVDQFRALKLHGRQVSLEALGARVRNHIQHKDEHALLDMFREDFRGYEEPEQVQEVLDYAEPYLPACGVNGEMVLNVGKSAFFARKGLDGVIDISPFTCMNGIVGEAVYPRVSRDYAGIPIRNFYFDGTQSDLDRDIGIFLELAKSYRRRKPWPRTLPAIAKAASAT